MRYCAEMGELGLLGLPFPEEYGGAGADFLSYCIAIEEISRGDVSVGITMEAHTSLGDQPILPVWQQRTEGALFVRLGAWRKTVGLWSDRTREPVPTLAARRHALCCVTATGISTAAKCFITNAGTEMTDWGHDHCRNR